MWQPNVSAYLKSFPKLSFIQRAVVMPPAQPRDTFIFSGPAISETVTVRCQSTRGAFRVIVHPEWSPLGAQRFIKMVQDGFFTRLAFYRVMHSFLVQFGLGGAGDELMRRRWQHVATLTDDPKVLPVFPRGGVSFAGNGKDSRTTQLFISDAGSHDIFGYGRWLGREPWETPFGVVPEEDMAAVIDKLYDGYGDIATLNPAIVDQGWKGGRHVWSKAGIDYDRLKNEGNTYLEQYFPRVDWILDCAVQASGEADDETDRQAVEREDRAWAASWAAPSERSDEATAAEDTEHGMEASSSSSSKRPLPHEVPQQVDSKKRKLQQKPKNRRWIKTKTAPRKWTPDEDALLSKAVKVHGAKNWKAISEMVPGRNHTQCLQRWGKVLAPGLKKGHWRKEEDEMLAQVVRELDLERDESKPFFVQRVENRFRKTLVRQWPSFVRRVQNRFRKTLVRSWDMANTNNGPREDVQQQNFKLFF
eukprot:g576.t1